MKCPKCRDTLNSATPKGYNATVDACPKCKGIFLDQGEITQFIPNKKKVARLQAQGLEDIKQSGAHCPKCQIPMFVGKAPGFGIALDHCAKCNGLWFDHGELYEMIKA